jgi:hypothetical protein
LCSNPCPRHSRHHSTHLRPWQRACHAGSCCKHCETLVGPNQAEAEHTNPCPALETTPGPTHRPPLPAGESIDQFRPPVSSRWATGAASSAAVISGEGAGAVGGVWLITVNALILVCGLWVWVICQAVEPPACNMVQARVKICPPLGVCLVHNWFDEQGSTCGACTQRKTAIAGQQPARARHVSTCPTCAQHTPGATHLRCMMPARHPHTRDATKRQRPRAPRCWRASNLLLLLLLLSCSSP